MEQKRKCIAYNMGKYMNETLVLIVRVYCLMYILFLFIADSQLNLKAKDLDKG